MEMWQPDLLKIWACDTLSSVTIIKDIARQQPLWLSSSLTD